MNFELKKIDKLSIESILKSDWYRDECESKEHLEKELKKHLVYDYAWTVYDNVNKKYAAMFDLLPDSKTGTQTNSINLVFLDIPQTENDVHYLFDLFTFIFEKHVDQTEQMNIGICKILLNNRVEEIMFKILATELQEKGKIKEFESFFHGYKKFINIIIK